MAMATVVWVKVVFIVYMGISLIMCGLLCVCMRERV